jgi:hypothetical protein
MTIQEPTQSLENLCTAPAPTVCACGHVVAWYQLLPQKFTPPWRETAWQLRTDAVASRHGEVIVECCPRCNQQVNAYEPDESGSADDFSWGDWRRLVVGCAAWLFMASAVGFGACYLWTGSLP